MGCDGGTIPKRDELVRTKKKAEQKDRNSQRSYLWRYCAVSQTLLQTPVVACELGRLYNKEEIIKRLLNKTQDASNMGHIRGLKDVKQLNLSINPAYDSDEQLQGGQSVEGIKAPWICPLAGIEMSGKYGFCFSWSCGCVFSTRAMKEVPGNSCSSCGAALDRDDVVTINPPAELIPEAVTRMADRRRRAKEAKKEAKRKTGQTEEKPAKSSKKQKIANGSGNSYGAGPSKPGTSISGLASNILRGTDFSNVRSKDFSVARNPEHSEIYKSIFDTHKSAIKKLKSNWVTCNPQYY
uniref:Replication termination factor 2 n=2 Tax=Hirondellea gigas TaxID=1518452 RepID=A0A6A7FWW2_9CRUS